MTLEEAMLLWQAHRPDLADLKRLTAIAGIASNWRDKIIQRLAYLSSHRD